MHVLSFSSEIRLISATTANYCMMAIKLVISFVMIMCVTSQRILANPSFSESGSKQPSPVMVENNALVSPREGTADSQLSGKSKDIERPGLPGHRTLSSAASATAPHDIEAAVRSEIQTFMPMFVESAIKSLVPKIQLTVNEAVSGAMSSLVQSTINSAVKSISVDPVSSTPSQSGR